MAIQLYVYEPDGTRSLLDMYEEEPIKLTISAEDITDPGKITSSYSRQFRVPATSRNSRVFRWWYEVNTIDFDVSQKVLAEIYTDGLLFAAGHVRIQAAYVNESSQQIDIEIVFYGETRDFASQVGQGFMNSLDCSDKNHTLTLNLLEDTWLAFDDANLQLDGAVRYILADRGYTYDEDGNILQDSEITLNRDGSSHTKGFYKNANPLPLLQFTPIIQVKYLIDRIFAETSYTYTDDSVFNENWFRYLYTDGIPDASPTIANYNSDLYANKGIPTNLFTNQLKPVVFADEVYDNANAYNTNTGVFTVQSDQANADISLECDYTVSPLISAATIEIRLYRNATIVDVHSDTGVAVFSGTASLAYTGPVTAGDQISVKAIVFSANPTTGASIASSPGFFRVDNTPLNIVVSTLLKNDVKKLDFLKSVLTKFRLVMVPTSTNGTVFSIRPWVNYVGTGQRWDWTKKMDLTKDAVLEPTFYDQSATILFADQPDTDKINNYHQTNFNKVYGQLLYDSQNEIIENQNDITTIFAPTPVDQIQGALDDSTFIIPYFSSIGDEQTDRGHSQHLPVRVKPRLLFWNGLAAIDTDEGWHYTDGTTTVHNTTNYPRASYLSQLPATADTLNLNWFREFAYFGLNGGPNGTSGTSVYEGYWNYFVESLYDITSRKLTAHFVLGPEDLRYLSFDDAIFIKNSWWRLNKIMDAPLDGYNSVKVELIKLLQFPGTQAGAGAGGWGFGSSGIYKTRYYNLQECISGTLNIVAEQTAFTALANGISVKVDGYDGYCWEVMGETTGPSNGVITTEYVDCAACEATLPVEQTYYYVGQNCVDEMDIIVAKIDNQLLANGQAFKVSATPDRCYFVTSQTSAQTAQQIIQVFVDCVDCQTI